MGRWLVSVDWLEGRPNWGSGEEERVLMSCQVGGMAWVWMN